MFFAWLKPFMPRGLYGRALLILVLPVLTLQLLVSVIFIQRHFDGVTGLMTSAVSIELRFLQQNVAEATTLDGSRAALELLDAPLELVTVLPSKSVPTGDIKRTFDITGRVVIATLREQLVGVQAVSLADPRRVAIWLDTGFGPLEVTFSRKRVSASNPHQLLVIMVILGAVMTTIAYFFLRNQLRPIKRMAAAAADYGRGRLVPYTPSGAVEVRAAGMAFLDMRNRLERQTQSRTMMLSGVSHDLRTPLTRLRLGLSMIDSDESEPLIRDVDDMQRLLDAFLDFARSDAGDVAEDAQPHQIVATLLADCARAGQPVTATPFAGPEVSVKLRPLAIKRALENLVANALRYGEHARLGLHITDRVVRFVVEDDGPGIPDDKREEAIRPFVRLDPARNQDRGGGVGLGLAIVSDIARVHGGVLQLGKSSELGGLKAELILPR